MHKLHNVESQAAGSDLVVTTPTVLLFGLSRLRGTSNIKNHSKPRNVLQARVQERSAVIMHVETYAVAALEQHETRKWHR